ncbi:hypothetical protein [Arthrobacter sp. EPSL27]|uniref:hypothetical protein n=1 Tax=Arthrobacter sp. EPSL27 TaxID=1745378 RepID=UPI0007487AE9|nr:hypothetical protein [Arthrobacter sp. EPSL27]KUM32711.1 hypothetical protein AR539_11785 [Arthrobacter sp. EPSL27]
MGDTGGANVRDEISDIVQRIAARAHADERLVKSGTNGELPAELDAALAFLPQLRLRTLRALEEDLARPDSLATGGMPGNGQAGEPGVARFLVRVCAQTRRPYSPPRATPAVDAAMLDLLVLRDIRLAHGSSMYDRCLDGLKDIMGLGPEESLAEHGVARYGAVGIVSLLHTSVSLAVLQHRQTSAHITAQMGYAGVDAYADAKDDCHSMTAAFARWILQTRPSPAKVAALAANGRLARYSISPAKLDPDEVRAELAKVDVDAVAGNLAATGPESSGTGTGTPGRRQRRRPEFPDVDDGAVGSFEVTVPPSARNPATAGDAFEQHISRRESNAFRRLKAIIWVACPLAVVAISSWMAAPTVSELLVRPEPNAWKALAAFFLAEALGGFLIAMGISSWLDLRVSGFFMVARELNMYTVLQGRRDDEFLHALGVLRPGLFDRSATAALPRLFTVCYDKEGALLVGGPTQPFVVAAFHWLHVRKILAEPPVRGRNAKRGHGQRVVFLVRKDGTDVELRPVAPGIVVLALEPRRRRHATPCDIAWRSRRVQNAALPWGPC